MERMGRDLEHNTPQRLRGQTMCIGIVGPLSVSAARLGTEMQQAAQLAIEEQNTAGGILGAVGVGDATDAGGAAVTVIGQHIPGQAAERMMAFLTSFLR